MGLRGVPFEPRCLQFVRRDGYAVVHRGIEGEHERLGDVRELVEILKVNDQGRSSTWTVVGEVDDFGRDGTQDREEILSYRKKL